MASRNFPYSAKLYALVVVFSYAQLNGQLRICNEGDHGFVSIVIFAKEETVHGESTRKSLPTSARTAGFSENSAHRLCRCGGDGGVSQAVAQEGEGEEGKKKKKKKEGSGG